MSEIKYATTNVGLGVLPISSVSIDESIGGVLFDISGFHLPFEDYDTIYNNFGSEQVQLINNLEEANKLGLGNNGFMNGLVYYHLSMFYDYINSDAPLYIAFADCSLDWSFIETMQRKTGGKMFQLGIWTSQHIWEPITDASGTTIGFSQLIPKVKAGIEELTGVAGQPMPSSIPLSIILCANTYNIGDKKISIKKLPNALVFNAPKISLFICQDGSQEVLSMQSKNPNNAPVGVLGFAMAVLNLAGAEESIGAVANYNLNKNNKFTLPELPVGNKHNTLESVSRTIIETLAQNGYVVPVTYKGKEYECFFNNDTTLSGGDYYSIANNRVIHKCRRAVYSALLPYIHSNHLFEGSAKLLSAISRQLLEEVVGSALSGKLINKKGQYQINGYKITIDDSQNILNDDEISISYNVVPVSNEKILIDTIAVE